MKKHGIDQNQLLKEYRAENRQTIRQLAQTFKVTQERVRQILKKAEKANQKAAKIVAAKRVELAAKVLKHCGCSIENAQLSRHDAVLTVRRDDPDKTMYVLTVAPHANSVFVNVAHLGRKHLEVGERFANQLRITFEEDTDA